MLDGMERGGAGTRDGEVKEGGEGLQRGARRGSSVLGRAWAEGRPWHGNGGAALGARVQGPSLASNRRMREGRWYWGGRAARAGRQRPGHGRRRACAAVAASARRGANVGARRARAERGVSDGKGAARARVGW